MKMFMFAHKKEKPIVHLLLIDCSAGLFFELLLLLVDGASAWLIASSEALSDFICIIIIARVVQTIVRKKRYAKKKQVRKNQ